MGLHPSGVRIPPSPPDPRRLCARSSADRASGCGPEGRGFESRRARHSDRHAPTSRALSPVLLAHPRWGAVAPVLGSAFGSPRLAIGNSENAACRLRSSLTHVGVRSLRCSAPPSARRANSHHLVRSRPCQVMALGVDCPHPVVDLRDKARGLKGPNHTRDAFRSKVRTPHAREENGTTVRILCQTGRLDVRGDTEQYGCLRGPMREGSSAWVA